MDLRQRLGAPLLILALSPLWGAGCSDSPTRFNPEEQTPFMEQGLILPPHSLPCVPVGTGVAQDECNHHGSSVVELSDGTIAAAWFHGEREKSVDSRLVWSRRTPGATTWTDPEILYDEPDLAEGNVVLWVAGDGTLRAFFVTIFGDDAWGESKIRMLTSPDQGATWLPPTMIRDEYCWLVRNHPVRLQSGEIILPVYDECLYVPTFIYSSDDFATWEEQPIDDIGVYLFDHVQQIQPSVIERDDGTLVAITRDAGGSERIQRMESTDHGRTWTPSETTDLPNSNTAVEWLRLLDGHVVVVFNNSPDRRFPLSAALSVDEGGTFTAIRTLNADCDRDSCSYAYPSIIQSSIDGSLWVTYTHNRETIGWVHFNEAWLMQGTEQPHTTPGP